MGITHSSEWPMAYRYSPLSSVRDTSASRPQAPSVERCTSLARRFFVYFGGQFQLLVSGLVILTSTYQRECTKPLYRRRCMLLNFVSKNGTALRIQSVELGSIVGG